jgi:hypothetical protein
MSRVVAALLTFVLLLFTSIASAAPFAEIVTGEADEHEVRLHIKSTLREPVIATKAAPVMPPFFAKTELEAALEKYGAYLLDHVHVQARARTVTGKVVGTKLLDAIDAPVNQTTDLEKHFAEVDLAYTTETQDPISLSFDVLADQNMEALYSVDVRGRKHWKADLTSGNAIVLDIAEPAAPANARERLEGGPAPRRSRASSFGFAGLAMLVAISVIGWEIWKRVRRRSLGG